MGAPPLYADPEFPGTVEMVPGLRRRHASGGNRFRPLSARSSRSSRAGPLVAQGRALRAPSRCRRRPISKISSSRRSALPTRAFRSPPRFKQRVAPLAKATEPVLEPARAIDRVRGHFMRFIEDGRAQQKPPSLGDPRPKTNRRAHGLSPRQRTGARLRHKVSELDDPRTARIRRWQDLIIFVTSDRCAAIRKQIGLSSLLERVSQPCRAGCTAGWGPNPTCSGGRGQTPMKRD